MRVLLKLFVLFFLSSTALAESSYYIFDTERSSVQIITDSGGFFKSFGHKHLITLKPNGGNICYHPQGASFTTFSLHPVEFLIDDSEQLKMYPELADEEVSAESRQGTRENMLGEDLLNAKKYPVIGVRGELTDMEHSQANIALTWHALGKPITLHVTGTLTIDSQNLTFFTEFERATPQLGFPVFSTLGGALEVGNSLRIIVKIHALVGTDESRCNENN